MKRQANRRRDDNRRRDHAAHRRSVAVEAKRTERATALQSSAQALATTFCAAHPHVSKTLVTEALLNAMLDGRDVGETLRAIAGNVGAYQPRGHW